MLLSPGTRLGPYEISAALGSGGMGEVYKAVDTRLGRAVAIKTFAGSHGQRFLDEARAIAALNHPHICVLLDVGPDYLVMEYLDGAPPRGPMPLDETLRVAEQVASALETAHAKGIVHRDLKPANIMITAAGAKVLDFGLARLAAAGDDVTRTIPGTVLGTAGYMSPEQAKGHQADARSDVFSFGAVVYELLSGRPAFGGSSLLDMLNAVVRDEPPPIDSPASALISRCLAKEPSGRFQSMAEVKAALQRLRGGARVESRRPTMSIAVLPFANLSHDKDDEYFSDGLAEEIINALAQVPGLKVVARTSSFAFKGRADDIRQIAGALGVSTVLEGAVRRAGSRLRVTAQLIQAWDGTHLWSQRFDAELTDIFTVQDEISASIVSALKLKLGPVVERRMPSIPAYDAYLKYRYYQWRFTPEAAEKSRECLEQALALDPDFALPYVGLADHHLSLATVGIVRTDAAMTRTRQLAIRALELEADLPEAQAMLGFVACYFDYDWPEAERRFRLSMARETVSGAVRSQYAMFLLCAGRADDACREIERVLDDDPLCQMWHYIRSVILQSLGRDDEAIAAVHRSVELDSHFWLGWVFLGMLQSLRQAHADALRAAENAVAAAPWAPLALGLMAAALTAAHQRDKAETFLARLRADPYNETIGLAYYHVARGEPDQAVARVVEAIDRGFTFVTWPVVSPFARELCTAAGWHALRKKLNLVN